MQVGRPLNIIVSLRFHLLYLLLIWKVLFPYVHTLGFEGAVPLVVAFYGWVDWYTTHRVES